MRKGKEKKEVFSRIKEICVIDVSTLHILKIDVKAKKLEIERRSQCPIFIKTILLECFSAFKKSSGF